MTPEQQIVVDKYLQLKDPHETAQALRTSKDKVLTILRKASSKKYIDQYYLESGYANKHLLQETLDKMITAKLEEAEESGIYSKKDLADLLELSHKFRIAEEKLMMERMKLDQSLKLANVRISQTESLTGRKLAAADERFKLKLEHDKKLREKEVNAYSSLLERLLKPEYEKIANSIPGTSEVIDYEE